MDGFCVTSDSCIYDDENEKSGDNSSCAFDDNMDQQFSVGGYDLNEFNVNCPSVVTIQSCSEKIGWKAILAAESPVNAPPGSTYEVVDDEEDSDCTTATLYYTPQRGHEGEHTVCFRSCLVEDGEECIWGIHGQEHCETFNVNLCTTCNRPGETLLHVGQEYHSNWMQIWSVNHHIYNPDQLDPYTKIHLGPQYETREGDDLALLADRFGTTEELILSVNPQIVDAGRILPDRKICVLPAVCDDTAPHGKYQWNGGF